MAFQRRRRAPTRTRTTRRAPVRTRRAAPRKRAVRARAPAAQTIRIVLEQPQVQAPGMPTSLPEQVGAVQATSPRKSRF